MVVAIIVVLIVAILVIGGIIFAVRKHRRKSDIQTKIYPLTDLNYTQEAPKAEEEDEVKSFTAIFAQVVPTYGTGADQIPANKGSIDTAISDWVQHVNDRARQEQNGSAAGAAVQQQASQVIPASLPPAPVPAQLQAPQAAMAQAVPAQVEQSAYEAFQELPEQVSETVSPIYSSMNTVPGVAPVSETVAMPEQPVQSAQSVTEQAALAQPAATTLDTAATLGVTPIVPEQTVDFAPQNLTPGTGLTAVNAEQATVSAPDTGIVSAAAVTPTGKMEAPVATPAVPVVPTSSAVVDDVIADSLVREITQANEISFNEYDPVADAVVREISQANEASFEEYDAAAEAVVQEITQANESSFEELDVVSEVVINEIVRSINSGFEDYDAASELVVSEIIEAIGANFEEYDAGARAVVNEIIEAIGADFEDYDADAKAVVKEIVRGIESGFDSQEK